MTIKRSKHDSEHPYTVISNSMLRDMTLSLKAKAVLCICLSFAEEWQFNLTDMTSRLNTNKNSLNKSFLELEAKGYLIRSKKRNNKGRIIGVSYNFFEKPIPLNQDMDNQDMDNQDMDNQVPDNQDMPTLEPQKIPIRNNNSKKYQRSNRTIPKNVEKAKIQLEEYGRRLNNG